MMRLAALLIATTAAFAAAQPLPFTGVNLAGGEFGKIEPGQSGGYGKIFTYPQVSEYAYFTWHGANTFRFPFHWESIQPEKGGELDSDLLGRLKRSVELATDKGYFVELDPHNYARYYGQVIGAGEVSAADFADFWSKLAKVFADNPRVWFGLVNEPHGIKASDWFDVANAAIAAIRETGATNLILLPGTAYSGAHAWQADWYGGSNADSVGRVKDPLNHLVIEVHQYLDKDSSGTHNEVVGPKVGVERLRGFVDWCRANGYRAFLGEFAVPASPEGQVALENMLKAMEVDRDVWLGWTWWAAGAWWSKDYMFSIQPNGGDKPQLAWLLPHLNGRDTPRVRLVINEDTAPDGVPCGEKLGLAASPPVAGQTFVRWTGDTAFLDDPAAPNTVLTVPYRDVVLGTEWK